MPFDANTQALWTDAVEEYEKETTNKIGDHFQKSAVTSPEDLLAKIEASDNEFKDFRHKHERLWTRLKSFAKPIIQLGNLTSSLVGNTPAGAPAAVTITAVLQLLTACQGVSDAYDWLENIFVELEEFSRRLTVYMSSDLDAGLKQKIVAILVFVLRICGRSELLIKRNRFREYLRINFIGKDDKTLALSEELQKALKNEQSYVLAATFSKASTAAESSMRTEDKVTQLTSEVQSIFQTAQGDAARQLLWEQMNTMISTLCTPAASAVDNIYSLQLRTLLKGSGTWLEKESLFDLWMHQRLPILWIFGGPGVGKSFLSTWLINYLLARHGPLSTYPSGISVGYFFIKENNDILRNPNIIFKTLAWQIQQNDQEFKRHVIATCQQNRNVARAEDTWENIFLSYYQSPKTVGRGAILVIDGLDEADSDVRKRLLRIMKDYARSTRVGFESRIQFAVIGRTTLRSDLKILDFDREERFITVSTEKNLEDIKNYITDRLKSLSIVQEMRRRKASGLEVAQRFARGIRRKILEGADGVFMWARLLLDQLEGKDEAQINRILVRPPQDLLDMIHSVFNRIAADEDIDSTTTRKLLTWIAYSRRPPLFGEIDIVVRLPSDTPNWILWNQLRGKFASVLNARYPRGYDPDRAAARNENDRNSATAKAESSAASSDQNEDGDFDLGEDSDDDHSDESDFLAASDEENGEPSPAREANKSHENEGMSADSIYNTSQKRTVFSFSHQQMRDYLVMEGDPSTRRKDPLPIDLDISEAETTMTITCLQMLRAASEKGKDEGFFYATYPTFNLWSHLSNIQEEKLNENDRICITEHLVWLLHEEAGGRIFFYALEHRHENELDDFWRIWFLTNKYTKLVQQWIGNAPKGCSFSDAQLIWMQKASTSIPELLKPLARFVAHMWLVKPGYDTFAWLDKSEYQVWLLKGYLALDDDGHAPERISTFIWQRDGHLSNLTVEELKMIAAWPAFEEDSQWYAALGWIIYETGKHDEAINILSKAIEMDPHAWPAMEATARCYADGKGDYRRGIEWMDKAAKAMPSTMQATGMDSWLTGTTAIWERKLGNEARSLEIAERAWTRNMASIPATESYLVALASNKRWADVIRVARGIRGDEAEVNDSNLVDFLTGRLRNDNMMQILGKAARHENKPEFLMEAIMVALDRERRRGDEGTFLRSLFQVSDLCYQYYDQDEQSCRLYEECLDRIRASNRDVQRRYRDDRIYITNKLAQIHYDNAVAATKAGHDSTEAANKLKRLAIFVGFDIGEDEEIFAVWRAGYPSMLYGRWLKDFTNAPPATWRRCFRARMLKQMNGLDDDDPTNDEDAVRNLACTLLQAGDKPNAGALIAVMMKRSEDQFKQLQEAKAMALPKANEENEANDEQANGKNVKVEEITFQFDATERKVKPTRPASTKTTTSNDAPSGTTGDWHLLTTPSPPAANVQDGNDNSSGQTKFQVPLKAGDEYWACSACVVHAESVDALSFCEICDDGCCFCPPCLEKVKSGTLEARMCTPNHNWYRGWPIDEEMREVAVTFEEGGILLRKEWLAKLRDEWLKG